MLLQASLRYELLTVDTVAAILIFVSEYVSYTVTAVNPGSHTSIHRIDVLSRGWSDELTLTLELARYRFQGRTNPLTRLRSGSRLHSISFIIGIQK